MSLFLLVLSLYCCVKTTTGYYPPEQIHIALGRTPDSVTLNWLTWDYPIITKSLVLFGNEAISSSLTETASGSVHLFTDGGSQHINRTIHLVNITGLNASTKYYYQVGDPHYGYSSIYSFKTQPNAVTLSQHLPTKYCIYGDLGTTNSQILSYVTEAGLNDEFDVVIHVGDMAYQPQYNNGSVGDQFMNDIQSLATHIPYMNLPGNGESAYNFSHYSERFRGLPYNLNTGHDVVYTGNGASPNNWYFSWNNGFVHWIVLSTEIYFDFPSMIKEQYKWLISDLIAANKNRTLAPWVIVTAHRPMYCDGVNPLNETELGNGCGPDATKVRDGIYGLEDVFYEYGVDFYICGHEHNYERMYDIYKNKTTKSTVNMPSTTYIVTGVAGCFELPIGFNPLFVEAYTAFRTVDYSFTRFNVYNSTHIHLQQVIAGYDYTNQGTVIDEIYYIQETHGPFKINYPLN